MKKKILSALLVIGLICSSIPFTGMDTYAASKKWVGYNPDRYVDAKKATTLRSKSSTSGKSLGTVPKGKRIISYGYDKYSSVSWYKVKYGSKTGYIKSTDAKLSYQAYSPAKKGTTTANLYMRSGVGLNYSKKVYIKSGSQLTLHGYYRTEGYDWYKVTYGNYTGYVSSKYVKRNEDIRTWVQYDPDRYVDVKRATTLRSKSSTSGKSLGTVPKGKRIISYGYDKYSSGSWYKVKYGSKTGYIKSTDAKLSYQAYSPAKKGTTTANLYMRSGVGLNYSKKVYIKSGSQLTLHGYYRTEGYDWYKVTYGNYTGYVSSKYVKRNELKTPVITKFISTRDYVKLSWSEVSGASQYEIHRKINSGAYKKIATVDDDELSYVDYSTSVGKSYTYKVISRSGKDKRESVARKVTPIKIAAPTIKHAKRYSSNGKEYVQFNWKAIKGRQYYVYKKTLNGSWTKLATVNATSTTGTYTDANVKKGTDYIYTVKEVQKVGDILYKYGDYDSGVKTIADKVENINIDAGNLSATLTWEKVRGASQYKVYRKIGKTGSYRLIGTTNGTTFQDEYKKNAKSEEEKDCLTATYFTDPSVNEYVYTVRAYNEIDGKESYSDYLRDGEFHIENPSIVNVVKNSDGTATYEWGTLPNAESYILYSGNMSGSKVDWTKIKEVTHQNSTRQKETVAVDANHDYFTVQAKFEKDGKVEYSGMDEGFTLKNKKYEDQNILYIGDSITYGSPYKASTTKEVFSYPWRVQQLTGAQTCNPSIPGATYHFDEATDRYRMSTDVADKIALGEEVDPRVPVKETVHRNEKHQKYKDFDVVVMAAGTNDYSDNTQFGDLNSTNNREFNGAVNIIMGYIKEANAEREAMGKKPIKVVFVELFYSDRTKSPYTNLTNRFVTKNDIGLTLTDYQNNLNNLIAKYKQEGFDIYEFDTTEFVDGNTCQYATTDNLHMTKYTYSQIGNKLADFLVENVFDKK